MISDEYIDSVVEFAYVFAASGLTEDTPHEVRREVVEKLDLYFELERPDDHSGLIDIHVQWLVWEYTTQVEESRREWGGGRRRGELWAYHRTPQQGAISADEETLGSFLQSLPKVYTALNMI